MSKYQEVMSHVRVDDDMKKRILQKVEKELDEDKDHVNQTTNKKAKVIHFQRYAAVAATFAILLIGSYAVRQAKTTVMETASTSYYEEAATDSMEMAEAPAAAEEAMEESATATEEPAYEAETTMSETTVADNSAVEEASSATEESIVGAVDTLAAGSAEADKGEGVSLAPAQPINDAGAYNSSRTPLVIAVMAVLIPVIILLVIIGVIVRIVRKRKR